MDKKEQMELRSILPAMRVENGQWEKCKGIDKTTFIIEPYQRGYRWGRNNVKKLLDDLYSYSEGVDDNNIRDCEPTEAPNNNTAGKYDFYCLQALSVKATMNENEYELIDGQQRLTTIFLIYELFSAFCGEISRNQTPPFFIKYNRNGSETNQDCFDLTTKIHALLRLINKERMEGITPDAAYWSGVEHRRKEGGDEEWEIWFHSYIYDIKQNIRNLDKSSKTDSLTMDLYYLSEAAEEIIDYIREFDESGDTNKKLGKFLTVVKRNVLFLWYDISEIDENISPEDEFKSLNTNKVRLTNAELIKALVLRKEGIADTPENPGHRWEAIEQGLCKNELWAFISGEDKATRIDLILELFARGVNMNHVKSLPEYPLDKNDNNNEYWLFDWYEEFMQRFNEYKKEEKKDNSFSNVVLQSIEEIYDRICEWYDDVDIYHLIGLLTCFNGLKLKGETKKQEELIKDIFNWYSVSNNKDVFISDLKEEIRKRIASGVKKKNNEETVFIEDIIDSYHFDDDGKPYIFAILWALNAWETMEAAENNVPAKDEKKDKEKKRVPVILNRMPFSKINGRLPKKYSWTLEHIMPQNPEDTDTEQKNEMIAKYKKLMEDINNETKKDNIIKHNYDIHSIDNMALLTHWSNASISNGNLKEKREDIVRKVGKGEYVPCATINAFNLYYNMLNNKGTVSEDGTDYKYWTISDRDSYLEQIIKCLKDFGFKDNVTDSAEDSKEETR